MRERRPREMRSLSQGHTAVRTGIQVQLTLEPGTSDTTLRCHVRVPGSKRWYLSLGVVKSLAWSLGKAMLCPQNLGFTCHMFRGTVCVQGSRSQNRSSWPALLWALHFSSV